MTAMRILAAGFIAALAFSPLSFAADAPPPPAASTDLTKVPKGTYELDNTHASVIFKINHMGFSNFAGRFDKIAGELKFDPGKPEKSKLNVTIETASINTNVAKLDTHLQGPDFFEAEKYPQIKFKSTKVEKLSDSTGKVTGDLTLHGVTKSVTLDVTFHGGGANPMTKKAIVGFGAHTTIKRSDFGMTKYVPMIGDDVELMIEAEFGQKS